MGISKASAQWNGGFKAGKGTMKPEHGAEVSYTAGTRFEGQAGSNPEELIGAALAGCFSMALSLALEKEGARPKTIRTSASVRLERETAGFTIKAIELATEADVADIDAAKFQAIAQATKKGCPVSRALGAIESITLEARLVSG